MSAQKSGAGKKRKKRRRKSRISSLIYRLLSLAAVIAALIFSVTIFFKITSIEIVGESRYASDELVRAAGISVGDNMFMINKYDAANKLFAEHPYLDTVRIRRRLPDTLEIIVADCVPVAAVADGDGEEVWIADAKGKLLEKMGKDSPLCEGLIAVSGCDTAGAEAGKNLSEVDEKRAKPLFDILHMAENNDILNHISSVELEKLYQVTMGYGDRLSVRLGAPEELEKKFRFLVYIVEQLSVTDRGIIDVSDTAEARFIPQ